jgi:hypothetical protein
MAATIQIHEMSGATAGVDKTSGTVRFKSADENTVDVNNPITIPGAGSNYSYTKTLRPYMAVPPDTQISNLRWYTGGTGFGTGITVNAKNLGITWASNVNTQMTGGSDLFGYTSGSPLDGDGTDAGPFEPADDDTYIGDLIRLQMVVADTASPGTLAAKTLTLAYDEI